MKYVDSNIPEAAWRHGQEGGNELRDYVYITSINRVFRAKRSCELIFRKLLK